MGEIADMMLEGDLCQVCGCYMEGGDGFPQTCPACRAEAEEQSQAEPKREKVACPQCGRRVKVIGLKDHQRDAHGTVQQERKLTESK